MIDEKIKMLAERYQKVTQEIDRLQIIKTKIEGAYEILSEMRNEQMLQEQDIANSDEITQSAISDIDDGGGE